MTGTLNYVENFDKFDKGAEGNFLALTFDVADDENLTFESATDGKPVSLNDGYLIYKVPGTKPEMKFKLERGEQSTELTLNISELVLTPKSGIGG